MDEDLIAFQLRRDQDPDGSKLRAALEAHAALGLARARRGVLIYLLAGISGLVWITAVWPRAAAGLRPWALRLGGLCRRADHDGDLRVKVAAQT